MTGLGVGVGAANFVFCWDDCDATSTGVGFEKLEEDGIGSLVATGVTDEPEEGLEMFKKA